MALSNIQKIHFLKGLPAAGTPCGTGSLPKRSYNFKRIGDVPIKKSGGADLFSSYQSRKKHWYFWKFVEYEAAELNTEKPWVKF